MHDLVMKDCRLVNEGIIRECDIGIRHGRIEKIGAGLEAKSELRVDGAWVLPGMIDDQVHFREPGFERKGTIKTESAAAVAGGVTSYLEMPNCWPQTTNATALEDKFARAATVSHANYGFYLGATNENLEDIKSVDIHRACGIKVFMGASTGNMLVDDPRVLEAIFAIAPILVATHCEHTPTILENERRAREKFGDALPPEEHPRIRSAEACYRSSSFAVDLARKHGTRLHVLHLTTAREMDLFDVGPVSEKHISAEVCVHHLFFDESWYPEKGADIKCNPAIKRSSDRDALKVAVATDRIDVIATDHAPHTRAEKNQPFGLAPAGLPLVQHVLLVLMELVRAGDFTIEQVVKKTAHAPAICFQIKERGFAREGYWADLAVVDPVVPTIVNEQTLLAKCGWSPFSGMEFASSIRHTLVNGRLAYSEGVVHENVFSNALEYDR